MPAPRRRLRVLHTADVHLESDSYGRADEQAAHRQHLRGVFSRIVGLALADDIDLLLIAGDLFDHNRVSDDAIAFVRTELSRLRQPVIILPGNHDALYANAIHDRHDLGAGVSHVHVIRKLQGQTVELPELETVVWGRAMEEHDREFRPLANMPARDEARWHLALGHGFFYERRQAPERSSPIFADEIRDCGWDYVALGHQHVQTDVSQGEVTAFYAGAPGAILRIDFSDADGVRVTSRPLP